MKEKAASLTIRTLRVGEFAADLSVSDRVTGHSRSTNLKEVFEPFFTSKAEGMGMGLSIARTIIEAAQWTYMGKKSGSRRGKRRSGSGFLFVVVQGKPRCRPMHSCSANDSAENGFWSMIGGEAPGLMRCLANGWAVARGDVDDRHRNCSLL